MYQRLWSLYYDCRSGAAFRIIRIYIHTKFQVKNLLLTLVGKRNMAQLTRLNLMPLQKLINDPIHD